MKRLFLSFILTVISVVLFAQNLQDVLYLKNGSIIHGSVLETIPGESVKIQTATGDIYVYKMKDVKKIEKTTLTNEDMAAPLTKIDEPAVKLKKENPVKSLKKKESKVKSPIIYKDDNEFFVMYGPGIMSTYQPFMETDAIYGWRNNYANGVGIGYNHSFCINSPFFLKVGINGTYSVVKRNKSSLFNYIDEEASYYDYYYEYYRTTVKMANIMIPVNFGYHFNTNKDLCISPSLGIYAKYNLMAKRKTTYKYSEVGLYNEYYYQIEHGDYVANDEITEEEDYLNEEWWEHNKIQYGFNVGVDFRYKKFGLGLYYFQDLNRLWGGDVILASTDEVGDFKMKTKGFHARFIYYF